MPSEPTRILIVEDDPGLAQLFGDKLRHDGHTCAAVDSARACLAWLATNAVDLMLLDYSLPDRLAPALVEELRTAGRLPPFIVVTGHGDERVAVEMMKLGARDYLVKDNLLFDRMPAVVLRTRRELEKEHRLAVSEAALKQSESLYHDLVETSQDLIWQCDAEGRYTYLNPAWEQVFGYKTEEMLGRRFSDFQHPEVAARDQDVFARLLQGGSTHGLETVHLGKAGNEIHLVFNAKHLPAANGSLGGTRGTAFDITERKRAEAALRQSEERLRVTLETTHIGVWDWDLKKDEWVASATYFTMLGYPPVTGPASRSEWLDRLHPEDRPLAAARIADILNGTIDKYEYEARTRHADGSYCWQQVRGDVVARDPSGRATRLVGTRMDITERKQAEEALQRSEALFRRTFDEAPVGSAIVRLDQTFQQVNAALCRFLGYSSEELEGKSVTEVTHPDDVVDSVAQIRRLLGGEVASFEFEKRYLRQDGATVWGRVSVSLVRDADGRPLHLAPIIQDITARKQAEAELKQTRAILQVAMDESPAGIAIADAPSGALRYVNDAGLLIRGGDRASIVNGVGVQQYVASWKLLDLDGRPLRTDEVPLARAVMFGETCSREFIIHRWDDDDRAVLAKAAPIKDEAGTVVAAVVVFLDITEQKRAERELEQFFNLVPDMVCIASDAGFFRKLNDEWVRVLGYSKDELMAVPFTEFVHPDDRAATHHETAQQAAGNSTASFVNRYRAKDGTYRWFEWNATSATANGLLFAAARDITLHRQAEAAVRESELRYRTLANSGPGLVWTSGLDKKCDYFNQTWLAFTGRGLEQELGDGWIEGVHPDDLERCVQTYVAAFGRRERFSMDYRLRHHSGEYRWIQDDGSPRHDSQGNFLGYIGHCLDITERKAAEGALRESEEKFAKVFHAAPAWVGITDLANGTYVNINDEALRLSGFTREEVIGRTSAELGWLSAEHRAHLAQEVREHGRVTGLEMTLQDKAGRTHIGWLSSELIAISARPCLLTIILDITQRKRAEEIIAWEAALMENSADICCVKDLDLRVLAVNSAFLRLAGATSAAAVIGKTDAEIFCAPANATYAASFTADERHAQTLSAGQSILREEGIVLPDGTERRLLTRKFPVFDSAGRLIATASTSTDVTERQRAEDDRNRSHELLAKLTAQVPGVVYQYRLFPDGRSCFPYSSPGMQEIYEYEPEQVREDATPVFGRLHPEDAGAVSAAILESARTLAPFHCEFRVVLPRQGLRWRLSDAMPERTADAGTLWYGIISDITERKRAEEALRESEEKHRLLVRHLHAGVVVHAPNTEILLANDQASTLLGLTIDQMRGKEAIDPAWCFLREDETPMPLAEFPVNRVLATRAPMRDQILGITHPGTNSCGWVLVNAFPNFDSTGGLQQIVVTFADITERRRAEEALRQSLHEKEALLKEVHHRVKNNLQVISSLLRLESGRVADPGTQAVLRDMQNRIRTMALLHESLYRSGNLAEVDMKAYLETLCQQLFRAASARSSGPVELQMAVAPMRIELNRTVPCGLIVNELVSNCLKHAFPDGRGGRVRVDLQPTTVPDEWGLCVADNGVGLPAGFTLENLPSLGLQLVSDLARQLQGRLAIGSGQGAGTPATPGAGTSFTVYFKALPPESRPVP